MASPWDTAKVVDAPEVASVPPSTTDWGDARVLPGDGLKQSSAAKPKYGGLFEPLPESTDMHSEMPTELGEAMGRHPYATAAVMGAANPPAAVEALAGMPVAAMAGAAEQMGYQKLAEIGARIAGPDHPYVGFALGLLPPFAIPGTASMLTGARSAAKAATAAAEGAEEKVATTADEAAAKQETANLAERVKAGKAAQAQQLEAKGLATQDVAASETERQRATMLGRTPEETQAAIAPAPSGLESDPRDIQRTKDFRGAYFDSRERIADNYGSQYQELEKKYGDKMANPQPLRTALKKWEGVIEEQGPAGAAASPVRALMIDAQALAPRSFVERGEAATGGGRLAAGARSRLERMDVEGAADSPATASFTKLRALRSAAERIAGSATSDRDRQIADDIAEAADKSLDHVEGVPAEDLQKLRALNSQYRDFKQTFDRAIGRDIATSRPEEAVPKIINNPKLARWALAAATPAEKGSFRDAFADWANVNKLSLKDIGEKVDHSVLKDMGFNLPDEAWLQMEPKQIELRKLMASSPEARGQFNSAFRQRLADLQNQNMQRIRNEGIAIARSMGDAGKPIESALFRAKSAQEINAAARQLAGMPDDQFIKLVSGSGKQANSFESSPMSQKIARESAANLAQRTPGQAAQGAVANLPTAGEAGRKALLTLKPGRMEAMMQRRLAFRAMFEGAGLMGTAALLGHASPYTLGMAGLIGATEIPLGTRALSRAALHNPEIADLAWRAVSAPRISGARMAGKLSADILAVLNAHHVQQRMQQEQKAKEENLESP